MTNELTVQERAVAALGLSDLHERLTKLAAGSKQLVEITNEDSYKQIHAARMVLKNERVDIAKLGKAARDDANLFAKAVIAEEKRIIGIIEPEESRLYALQKEHDDRAERERQEKIQREIDRVEGIQGRITELAGMVAAVQSMGLPSSEKVKMFIDDIGKIAVDDSFSEFKGKAIEVKASTLTTLNELLTAAKAREEEEIRVAAERKELAELRAKQDKRDAEDQSKREAEEKKQREELKAQQNEQAEAQQKIDAENKRLADERAKFEEEQKAAKLKAEREEEAERKQKEAAKAAAKRTKYPGDKAIIAALANHFSVPEETVTTWLTQIRKAA